MTDYLSFHDLSQERWAFTSTVPGWSLLFITECLFKTPPSELIGEQYGKMELKYPEGVTAIVYYVLRESFMSLSSFLINSVETAAPFNLVNH